MKLRILALLCYLAAFAGGALIVDYWVDRQHSMAQASQQAVAAAVTDSAQQAAMEAEEAALRGPVYDSGTTDPRLIRVRAREASGPAAVPATPVRDIVQASPPVSEPASATVQPIAAPIETRVPLEKMIGQMLIFGFQGTSPDQKWPRTLARQLADGTIGGAIFLRNNLEGRTQARRLMKFLHAKTSRTDPVPLFAVDQEGGQVQRLASNVGVKRWPSASRVGRGTLEQAKKDYTEMAAVLKDWGFNVNFGPVVDVNVNPANPVIGKLGRSFSGDPYKVSDFARAFIDAHREQGVLTALKHFPGHGSSRKDSHLGFTDISSTWQQKSELAPYRELLGSGEADMVMTGHLYLGQFAGGGKKKYPATLSKAVVTGLLRNGLGYDGVVVSDDMEMGAIRKHYGTYEAAIMAIKAGVDLLIVSNSAQPDMHLPEKYIAEIARAARSDPDLKARIAQSYLRIIALKQKLASVPEAGPRRRAS